MGGVIRRWGLGAALIVGLAFASYWPALRGGFVLDDHVLLTGSRLVQAPDGLYRFWLTAEAVDYWPVRCGRPVPRRAQHAHQYRGRSQPWG